MECYFLYTVECMDWIEFRVLLSIYSRMLLSIYSGVHGFKMSLSIHIRVLMTIYSGVHVLD